jgi:hypothetical protein
MPRELRILDVEPFPSESEPSDVSRDSTPHSYDDHRRQPPPDDTIVLPARERGPDDTIVLTARETADAIELFAPEADVGVAPRSDQLLSIVADLPLNTVGEGGLDDAAAVGRIDALWIEPRAAADDAAALALPAPASVPAPARVPASAPAPSENWLARLTRIAAAAMLLLTIVAATLAFRILLGGALNEDRLVPSAPLSAPVVAGPVYLVDSGRTLEATPLASGIAPRPVTTEPEEAANRVSPAAPPVPPVPHVLGRREPESARLPPAVQSRSTGVLATAPSVLPAPRMPTIGAEPEKPIAPAAAAPASEAPPATAVAPPAVAAEGRGAPAAPPSTDASRTEAAATDAIVQVLHRYRAAFNTLDAEAARSVWPGADVRGLGRAFEGLQEQQLSFNACAITLEGERAVANCRGTATYVPKVGRRNPRVETRQWRFEVERHASEWLIQSVAAR